MGQNSALRSRWMQRVVHADDLVDDRAKVSDHIAMTGASLKAETMLQMS
jgi:hypothetical protein